jgi:hypothetical protein
VLAALTECGYIQQNKKNSLVMEQIRAEFKRMAWLLGGLRDIPETEKTLILRRALNRDLEQTRTRLFYLFGFVYDERAVKRARQAIERKDGDKRSYAIEVIDSLLIEEHKRAFIPLLEHSSAEESLKRMGAAYKQEPLSNPARLSDAISNPYARQNPWLVVTALDAAGKFGLQGGDDGGMDETMIARMKKSQSGVKSDMLSVVERVVILKSLSIFAETPDEALAELADMLEELEVPAGREIVQKDEPGDSLYIVVKGAVDVMNGERVLNQLKPRAVFGELSLLDSAPRTATIRAAEETLLLRLDQEPFYEILGDYVEVAMGTIHMLTRNLRSRTGEVLELNRMLGS